MRHRHPRALWLSLGLAALLGAVGGTVAGHADAEDRATIGEEACNDSIPPEVLAAVAELAAEDDADVAGSDDPVASEEPTLAALAPTADPAAADWISDSRTEVIETSVPSRWMPRGRRCQRRRGRRVCDGPRRAPRPAGEAAALAERLGIGSRRAASSMLLEAPPAEWIAAVEGRAHDTLLWPVPAGRLWRGFGYVRRGRARRRLHKGLDIGAPAGSPIRSVNDGLVIYADNEVSGYGNLMMVLHRDGSVAFYAHCQRLYLFAGQQVRRGQVLGEVGHTGIAHGDHLHFELRAAGQPRNPLRRMVGRSDEPTDSQASRLTGSRGPV